MLPWHFIPRNHDNFIDPIKHDQNVMVTKGKLELLAPTFHDILFLETMTIL